ncbi:MAG: hypothetical protein VXW15_03440, partial [Bdellovibrionota bacterium]|nr:hypothetical protein [Bdellovibrionota bacterium]
KLHSLSQEFFEQSQVLFLYSHQLQEFSSRSFPLIFFYVDFMAMKHRYSNYKGKKKKLKEIDFFEYASF